MTTPTPFDPRIAQEEAARGQALLRAGKDSAALDAFERAAWMAPDDPRIQWALANTLWRVGRSQDAVPVYERVIALLPNEPAPRCNLAELLAVLDRVDDARVQIASAAAFAPDDPHIYLAEAVVRLANRRPIAAEEAARRAVASGILPKFAHHDLGDALVGTGQVQRGPGRLPNRPPALCAGGSAHDASGFGLVDDSLSHTAQGHLPTSPGDLHRGGRAWLRPAPDAV